MSAITPASPIVPETDHVAGGHRPPAENGRWNPPGFEWEEDYEPVVFAASCTYEPMNCLTGPKD